MVWTINLIFQVISHFLANFLIKPSFLHLLWILYLHINSNIFACACHKMSYTFWGSRIWGYLAGLFWLGFLKQLSSTCWAGCGHLKGFLCQRISFQALSHGCWQEASVHRPIQTGISAHQLTFLVVIWETKIEAAILFLTAWFPKQCHHFWHRAVWCRRPSYQTTKTKREILRSAWRLAATAIIYKL